MGWITAAPYLIVRAGGTNPVRLVVVDGSHVVAGVGLVFVLAAWCIRAARHVSGDDRPPVTAKQRWLARALVSAYGAVVITGVVAVVPVRAPVRNTFVDVHLIAAAWATVPTVALVLQLRRAVGPRPRSRNLRPTGMLLAVVALTAVWAAAWPHGVAPLTQIRGGGSWAPLGPRVFTDGLARSPDGAHLVAAGSGVFVSDRSGRRWHRVGPFSGRDPVLGLGFSPLRSDAVLVGTTRGLYAAPALSGPYRPLPLPAGGVHAVVAFGPRPDLWATTDAGIWRSVDGGEHWSTVNTGLTQPATAWALTAWRGTLFASDLWHVYRWHLERWDPASDQQTVIALDPLRRRALAASSMGAGIRVLSGGRWSVSDAGIPALLRGGIHVTSVSAPPEGPVFATTMTAGIDVSLDGGRTWFAGWPGLAGDGVAWRVVSIHDRLIAATDRGLLAYDVPNPAPATTTWWLSVIVSGAVLGWVALEVDRRRGRGPGQTESEGTGSQDPDAASRLPS